MYKDLSKCTGGMPLVLLALLLEGGGTGFLFSCSVSLGSESLSGSLSCSLDTLLFPDQVVWTHNDRTLQG